MIYLKEHGCAFPSNAQPKVWGNLSHDVEEAFETVGKELHAMGLI